MALRGGGRGSGDGFVTVSDGSVRWGRFGAAGVLVRHIDTEGVHWYFLARRSIHTHQGGSWAVPGGALDHGESPLEGALREFGEEIGPLGGAYRVVSVHQDDHGGWSYWTVILEVDERFPVPERLSWETAEARWVAADELKELDLFAAFRASLERMGI
ncbi:MAG TPA: NUDIX hydrolase [Acidimicrobiales bacterium]|nr:NUDIX hydrolase [Acidimicrobiales bacterium]